MKKKTVCSIAVLLILGLCLYVVYSMGNRKSPAKIELRDTPAATPSEAAGQNLDGTPAVTNAPTATGTPITGAVSVTPVVNGEAVTGTVTPSLTPTPTVKTGENDLPPVVIDTSTPEPTEEPVPSGKATPTPSGGEKPTPKPTNIPTKSVTPTPTVAPTKVPKGGNVGDDGVIRLPVIPAEDK